MLLFDATDPSAVVPIRYTAVLNTSSLKDWVFFRDFLQAFLTLAYVNCVEFESLDIPVKSCSLRYI